MKRAPLPDLPLDLNPVIGRVYIHQAIPERLVVGSLVPRGVCRRCKGTGTELAGLKRERRVTCEVCGGRRFTQGSVLCYHPQDEEGRRLRLLWSYDEFFSSFRDAAGVGESLALFT